MIDHVSYEKIPYFMWTDGMIMGRTCAVFRATKALVTNTLLCYNFS